MAHLITLREDAETIGAIAQFAAENLKERYDVDILDGAVMLPTLGYSFFAAIVERLNRHKSVESSVHINFGDLFTVGITHQEEEDAEKEGNFTPFIIPGEKFEKFVSGEINSLAMSFAGETIDFGDDQEIINQISDFTVKYMKREYDLPFDGQAVLVSALAYELFAAMIEKLNENKPEEGSVEINFAQLFDIGIAIDEGTATPYLRAGQELKLMIKDDNVTE